MERKFEIAGVRHKAAVIRKVGGVEVEFRGRRYQASLHPLGGGEFRLELDGVSHRVWLAVKGDGAHIHAGGANWSVRQIDSLAELSGSAGGAGADAAEAPMPGTVVRVEVKPGDAVKRGQTLMVIESMKLETTVEAWRDGVVAEIHHEAGATFDRRTPLISLEPEG